MSDAENKEAIVRMVTGLQSCAKAIAGIIDDWDLIDSDLKESYTEDIFWMFDFINEHKEEISEDKLLSEIVSTSRLGFAAIADDMDRIFGRHADF